MPKSTQDLSLHHRPVHSNFLLTDQRTAAEYSLSNEQIEFFHEHGYLKGIRILSDEQVEVLRDELAGPLDARSEVRDLFYEYNSERVGRSESCVVPCPGRMADRARFSRSRVASCIHNPRGATSGRSGAVLARPTLLQVGSSRRSRGMAPGLFLLDTHSASRSPHLLDWP